MSVSSSHDHVKVGGKGARKKGRKEGGKKGKDEQGKADGRGLGSKKRRRGALSVHEAGGGKRRGSRFLPCSPSLSLFFFDETGIKAKKNGDED